MAALDMAQRYEEGDAITARSSAVQEPIDLRCSELFWIQKHMVYARR